MGASVGGRPSGTWGDAGLFSFDKGKNVSAIDGGVVVTESDDVASALDEEMRGLPSESARDAGVLAAKALVYFAMLRPWLYWIPHRLPQLELGQTVFTTDFPLTRPARSQSALALTMLGRLDQFTKARVATAAALLEGLPTTRGLRPIQPVEGSTPVYLRFPLLAPDETSRQRLLTRLNAAGIGATGSYPRSIVEIADLDRLPRRSAHRGRRRRRPTHSHAPHSSVRQPLRRPADPRGAGGMTGNVGTGAGARDRVVYSAKWGVAQTLHRSGLLALRRRRALHHRAVVLVYHRLLPKGTDTWSHPGIVVTPATFERHMRILQREFRLLTLQEFEHHVTTGIPFRPSSCLVTFDDGWIDTYTEACPILSRLRVPAVVFLPTRYIGSDRPFWQERLGWLLCSASKILRETLVPGAVGRRASTSAGAIPAFAGALQSTAILDECAGSEAGSFGHSPARQSNA